MSDLKCVWPESWLAWIVTGLNHDWPELCPAWVVFGLNRVYLAWIVHTGPESCLLGLNRDGPESYRPESWLAWIMSGLSRGAWVMSGLNRAFLAWIKMGLNRDRPESWQAWIVSGLSRPAWIVRPESCRPESAGLNQVWIVWITFESRLSHVWVTFESRLSHALPR